MGVGLTLAVASCAAPDLRILDRPRPGTPAAVRAELKDESLAVLRRDGLSSRYRSDPAAALRDLQELHRQQGGEDRLLALADLCGELGNKWADGEPDAAVGSYLDSIRLSQPAALRLAESGIDHRLLLVHNESCAALTALLKERERSLPARFKGPLRGYRLSHGRPAAGGIDWAEFDELVPADRLELRNRELEPRRQFGIGGAMVAHQPKERTDQAERAYSGTGGFALPANTMVEFGGSGQDARLLVRNLMKVDEIRARGRRLPLNADWGSSLAYLYRYAPTAKTGWAAMLRPDKWDAETYLYELAPYDPAKIPVILVHGLMSTPETWVDMLNALRADPVLRRNYQAVVFRYPTGFPISRNAAAMRHKLEGYREFCRSRGGGAKLGRMVLIGHSMGGILSNVQIRDSGEEIRKLFFKRPLEELDLAPEKDRALRDLVYFEPNPDVERAIFIAAPLRGSDIASNPIGKLGNKLIRLPGDLVFTGFTLDDLLETPGLTDYGRSQVMARPDSIRGLRPDFEFLTTAVKLPVGRGIRYHSIIGSVQKNKPLEETSDKVVPYWSAHLDGAASEKVVDASHTEITHHPDSIDEVRRILYQHIGRAESR